MRVGGIGKAVARQSGFVRQESEPAPAERAQTGRALVVLAPATSAAEPPETFRQAPFLAQLLAMKDRHPQTRDRRRAEPHEAIAVYRAIAALAEHQ